MKGEKGDKTKGFNKIAELLYKTALGLDFRSDLSKLRAEFGIASQGFKTDKERNDWYNSLPDNKREKYWEDIFSFFAKYNLPAVSRWTIDYYICRNTLPPLSPKASAFDVCELDFGTISHMGATPTETKWKFGKVPFIRLYISDLASKEDVKDFIDKNWKAIKRNLGLQWAGDRRIVRPTKDEDKKIQEEIYFLSLQSRDTLGAKRKDYKETLITKIINKKYGKSYSDHNIRQIIVRQRKLRKKL